MPAPQPAAERAHRVRHPGRREAVLVRGAPGGRGRQGDVELSRPQQRFELGARRSHFRFFFASPTEYMAAVPGIKTCNVG